MVLEGGLAAVEGVEEDRFRWLTERERTEGRKGNAGVGRNGMKRVEGARWLPAVLIIVPALSFGAQDRPKRNV